jgi:hypothetical protein
MNTQLQGLPSEDIAENLTTHQLAGYILQIFNTRAKDYYHGEENFIEHRTSFMRFIEERYKSQNVIDEYAAAFSWLERENYLTPDTRQTNPGWYRLTKKGKKVQNYADLEPPEQPTSTQHLLAIGPLPDFQKITSDNALAVHLKLLWIEAELSYKSNAYFASIVMLGSLLEGILFAKISANPADANRSNCTPKNGSTVKPFSDWCLNDYIEVASEQEWIHKTRKDFNQPLRDYRNFVHPFQAHKMNARIDKGTVNICWQVVSATFEDLVSL